MDYSFVNNDDECSTCYMDKKYHKDMMHDVTPYKENIINCPITKLTPNT